MSQFNPAEDGFPLNAYKKIQTVALCSYYRKGKDMRYHDEIKIIENFMPCNDLAHRYITYYENSDAISVIACKFPVDNVNAFSNSCSTYFIYKDDALQ